MDKEQMPALVQLTLEVLHLHTYIQLKIFTLSLSFTTLITN